MLKNNLKKNSKKGGKVLKLNTGKLRAKNLVFESLPRTIGKITQ